MRSISRSSAAGLLCAMAAAAHGENAEQAIQSEFKEAMQRVAQNATAAPESPALTTYVLHDYLVAARLRRAVASAPSEENDQVVDAFLKTHEAQPVSRALRREWLASLAERRQWDWFLPRSQDVTDAVLVCDRLNARLATGDTRTLGADVLARWTIAQKPPEECDAVFAWLRTQNLITPEAADARSRAALAANNYKLAQEFSRDVPADRLGPIFQWIKLLEAPKVALTTLAATPQSAVEPDALLAGFTRLAFTDVSAALALLPDLLARADLAPIVRDRLRRAAALGSASSRLDGAVAAFADLPEDANDVLVQEWRVRAALWAGDWSRALTWLRGMPPSLAAQPRWRYWRARAVAATAGADAAAPLYAEIAVLRDYYGYLAADRLGVAYSLNIRPSPVNAQLQASLAADPGMIRAHALFDCDMPDDAALEYAVVVGTARPEVKVQAARLASDWGWYAQTIATLAQAGEWDDVPLRYPRPYQSEIAEASKQTGVTGDWLLGVMRQESLFRRDAVSRADARGLMQMLPPTAVAVAKRWHLPVPTRASLFDPAVSVPLGAAYLRELLDRYSDEIALALAAYNAGPMSVARWLPAKSLDADIWIENIPYTETRGYVQHILEHIVAFAVVRAAMPPRLSTLLRPVDNVL